MEVTFKPNGVSMSFSKSSRLFLSLCLLVSTVTAKSRVNSSQPFKPHSIFATPLISLPPLKAKCNVVPVKPSQATAKTKNQAQQWYNQLKPNQSLRDFFDQDRDTTMQPLKDGFFGFLNNNYGWNELFILNALKDRGTAVRGLAENWFEQEKHYQMHFDKEELYAQKVREIVNEPCEVMFVQYPTLAACFAFRQLHSDKLKVMIFLDSVEAFEYYGFGEEAQVGVMIHEATHGRDMANMEVAYSKMVCIGGGFEINGVHMNDVWFTPFCKINEGYTDMIGAGTTAGNAKLVTAGMESLYWAFGDHDDTNSTHPKSSFRLANCQAICELHDMVKKNPK
jgi:hypothetical protein